MAKANMRERECVECGAVFCGDRRACGPCAHAARVARGGYATVPCTSCGKGMHKSSSTSSTPMCSECRKVRLETWRAEGRPCATCGRVTGRVSKTQCLRCEMAKAATPCTVRTCERPSLAKGMCSTHYSWYWRALRGDTNGRGTWIMPSRRLSIYERDDWTCKICGEPVDRDADVGDNMAPSLDHIIPRSRGGGHESENLRTAHRVCNSRRGAGGEEVSDGAGLAAVRDDRGGAAAPAEPGAVWAAV